MPRPGKLVFQTKYLAFIPSFLSVAPAGLCFLNVAEFHVLCCHDKIQMLCACLHRLFMQLSHISGMKALPVPLMQFLSAKSQKICAEVVIKA